MFQVAVCYRISFINLIFLPIYLDKPDRRLRLLAAFLRRAAKERKHIHWIVAELRSRGLMRQRHGILDFFLFFFVARFACDIDQSANIWI